MQRRSAGRAAAAVCLLVVLPACKEPSGPLAPSNRLEWHLTPPRDEVPPGSYAYVLIVIDRKADDNAPLDVSVGHVPAGITPSFTSRRQQCRPPCLGEEPLYLHAAPEMPWGTFPISVTVEEVGGDRVEHSLELAVGGRDFSLTAPSGLILAQDSWHTFSFEVRRHFQFEGTVVFSLTGLTPDLESDGPHPSAVSFSPNTDDVHVVDVRLRRGRTVSRPFVDLTLTATAGALVKTHPIRVQLSSPGNEQCRDFGLRDTFDAEVAWIKTTEATPGFSDLVSLQATGGNTGGYRRMTHVLAGRGSIGVFHVFPTVYDPRTQGGIGRIVYSEDRTQFDPPFAGAAVASGFVVEQGGRRFVRHLPEFRETSWQHLEVSLGPSDLPGVDLSAAGGPIQFGYYRANSDSTATVQHGIDNWRVEICR